MADRKRPRQRPPGGSGKGRKKRPKKKETPGCVKYRKALLEAVSTPVNKIPVTGSYKLLMVIVAGLLMITPTLFLLMTFGGVFAWLAHVALHAHLMREGLIPAIVYLVPTVGGPFVIVSLFRVFFVDMGAEKKPRVVRRDAEPFLYEYVETLCESVGAPIPEEISLDADVNASASFAGGPVGFLTGRMRLTIGLPLVHGLTVAQLTGIIVHELGHFTQGSGMQLSYIIRHITMWFANAAYGPASAGWWLQSNTYPPWIVRVVCMFGIRISHSFLVVLSMLTNVVSAAMSRQMEFDADRLEALYVGSEVFVQSSRRLRRLGLAQQMALHDLFQFKQEGRLVDDFPRLIAVNVDRIDRELDALVRKQSQEMETKWYSSHPGDPERFANARSVQEEPAFHLPDSMMKARASILFHDVSKVSRGATMELYRNKLGSEFRKSELHDIEDILERREAEKQAAEALERFMRVEIPILYPIPISEYATEVTSDHERMYEKLKHQRAEMQRELKNYRQMIPLYESAEEHRISAAGGRSLEDLGVYVARKSFGMPSSVRDFDEYRDLADTAVSNLAKKMTKFENAAGMRLSCALKLLANDKFRRAMPDGDKYNDIAPLVDSAIGVSELMTRLRPVRLLCHRIIQGFGHIEGNQHNFDFMETLQRLVRTLHRMLDDLYEEMTEYDYPFDHADPYATIQSYVLPELPHPEEISGMIYVTMDAISRLGTVKVRVFSHLMKAAESVESFLNLEPIVYPEKEQSTEQAG